MRVSVTSSLLAISLVLSSGCATRTEPPVTAGRRPGRAGSGGPLSGEPAPLASLVGEVDASV